jgi:O-antigen ligase
MPCTLDMQSDMPVEYSDNLAEGLRNKSASGAVIRAVPTRFFDLDLIAALAFSLAVVGYWSFSPILEMITPGSPVSSVIFRLLTGGACLILLFISVTSNRKANFSLLIPFLIFACIYLYRMIDNYYIHAQEVYVEPTIAFSFFIGGALFQSLCIFSAAGRLNSSKLLICLAICCLVFLAGLGLNVEALRDTSEHRIYLEKLNPIAMTSTATTYLLLALVCWRQSGRMKLFAALSAPALLVIVAFSQSRGPLVSYLATIAFYLFLGKGPNKAGMAVGIVALGFCIVIFYYLFGIDILGGAFARFTGENDSFLDDTTTNIREVQWQAAWRQFLEDPLIGRYMFESEYLFYPHNIALEALMATGILGGVFFFWHFWLSFAAAISALKSTAPNIAEEFVALVFLKSFGESMFSGSIWGATGLWIASCAILALNSIKKAERARQVSGPKCISL